MSAVIKTVSSEHPRGAALLDVDDPDQVSPDRAFAYRDGAVISVARFLDDVRNVSAMLPSGSAVINLCEDRYAFLVAFCAILACGQTNLLPSSRAPQAVDDARRLHPASHALSDVELDPPPPGLLRLPQLGTPVANPAFVPRIAAGQLAVIAFTSGSSSVPKPHAKRWDRFLVSNTNNTRVIRYTLGLAPDELGHIVATVPPQHMYGMEMSVLLPLNSPFTIHTGRPFFPADIACALAEVPTPRVLVTTPVHLSALLRDPLAMPEIGAIVSATAPLSAELARAAEQRYGAPVIEMFGATETCVIAHRRTALEERYTLHPDVILHPQPDGTLVDAPQLDAPTLLQDIVELLPEGRFSLRGRHADLLEIAGKRASLSDLTQRLLNLDGVEDAVVFQYEEPDRIGIRRIAALAVAPQRSEAALLAELRRTIDPVFLPRPLRLIAELPRNATGKLTRAALLSAISR